MCVRACVWVHACMRVCVFVCVCGDSPSVTPYNKYPSKKARLNFISSVSRLIIPYGLGRLNDTDSLLQRPTVHLSLLVDPIISPMIMIMHINYIIFSSLTLLLTLQLSVLLMIIFNLKMMKMILHMLE